MEEAFAPYLSFLAETFMVPKHILEKEADPNAAAFNQAPVGTGAFKWAQRIAGDHIELVANTDYVGEGPYLERLVFKYIPDMTVLYTQFKSGDIDLVDQAYITADHYAEASTLPDRVVKLEPGASVESIYLNLEKPQFKDPAVRQALYAAIDRKAILEALYYGVHNPTETFMPQNSYYYNPNLPAQEFNLERARQILDEAGWVPGADGIRAKDGVRLSFANSTTSGNHLREQAQQFLQQTFAEIGVEMTISNLPAAVMWGDFWLKSQFESAISGVTNLIAADPDVTNRLHTKAIVAKGGKGSNTGQYSNPEVDALLDKGARTFDREERRAIYLRVQEIVRQDLPFLPLFAYTNVFGRKARAGGFRGKFQHPRRILACRRMALEGLTYVRRRRLAAAASLRRCLERGELNARLPAQPALAEPHAAPDRVDHRVRRPEPATGGATGAIRARSRHDAGRSRSPQRATGAESAAVDAISRLGLAAAAGRLGTLRSAMARRC